MVRAVVEQVAQGGLGGELVRVKEGRAGRTGPGAHLLLHVRVVADLAESVDDHGQHDATGGSPRAVMILLPLARANRVARVMGTCKARWAWP